MPKVRPLPANGDYDECEELLQNIQNGAGQSNCSALILRVNDYIKKPVIEHDLTGILNTYLEVLHSSEIYIKNGIFNTNFAEAALLVQGAATLYGKKVDLLWDFVVDYLNRNMSYEEKSEENKEQFEALEELKMKNKRRRKAIEENEEENTKPKRKLFLVDKKSAATVQGMNFEELQQFMSVEGVSPSIRNQSESYEDIWKDKSSKSMNQILENKIQCGRIIPDKNSVETRLSSNVGSNIAFEDIPPINFELLETNVFGDKEPMGDYGSSAIFDSINRAFNAHRRQAHDEDIPDSQIRRDNVSEYVLQKWMTEKSLHIDQAYSKFEEFVAECNQIQEGGDKQLCNEVIDENMSADDCSDLFDSFCMSGLDEPSLLDSSPCKSLLAEDAAIHKELGSFLDKRSDPLRKTCDSDIESGVFDGSSRCSPTTQKDGINGTFSDEGGEFLDTPQKSDPIVTSTPIPHIQETIIEEVIDDCQKTKKSRKLDLDFDEEYDEYGELIPKPKRRRKVHERLLPTITTKLKDFDKFFCQNYQPEDGEGTLDNVEDYSDDEEMGDLSSLDNNQSCALASESTSTEKSKNSTALEETFDSGISSQHTSDLSTTLESEPVSSFADIMGNNASSRFQHVLEWKKFISEKIGKQKKSDFDIHVEETHLIDSIGEIGNIVKYEDVCAGMSSAAVSHNFIAMLHLANTENVSILSVEKGKLSNKSLEVKLLSKDRHHEHLDEYNKPSEEAFFAYNNRSCSVVKKGQGKTRKSESKWF